MKLDAGVATDIGRVRERNEDSILVEPPLYAVADGMGGARGGDVASELALETVAEMFRAGKGTLAEQVREANHAVFQRSMSDRKVTGMGTTLTAALLDEATVRLAHVGDSRAYLWRAGALRMLTEDHTLVNRMVRSGEITLDEAKVHPHRNVLTRSIGTEPEVTVDEDAVPIMDGDRLLLCSDGLTAMVNENQIQAILEAVGSAQEAATRLVKAANRAGGVDNISVLVLDVHDDSDDESAPASTEAERPARRPTATVRGRFTRGRATRWAIRVGIVAAVLALLLVGLRSYLDRQWYVGESNGRVAVYEGIPAELAGLKFSHVAVETDLPAHAVDKLPLYQNLSEGITANSRDEALSIVDQMRTDVQTSAKRGSGS